MRERIQAWDERWAVRINGHYYGNIIKNVFIYFTHIGSVIPWIVTSLILFMLGQDDLAAILLSGIVQFGIINFIIKRIIRRKRPYKNDRIKDKIELRDFMLRNGGGSLPSGHSTTFTLMSLTLIYYFNNYYLFAFTIAGGLFVYYSRLYLGAHYPTDVMAGIGFGTALLGLVIVSIPTTLWILERIKLLFFAP